MKAIKHKIFAAAFCSSVLVAAASWNTWGEMLMTSETQPLLTTEASAVSTSSETTSINIASQATPSSKTTASHNNINAVNDGEILYTDGYQKNIWGTWSSSRPATHQLDYTWSEEHTFNRCVIHFWTDNANDNYGDNVTRPASYTIQYWDATAETWKDVTLVSGEEYTRERLAPNDISFEPVETTQLRLALNAQTDGKTYSAVGVSEWEAYAEVTEPTLAASKKNVILSSRKGYHEGPLTLSGVAIPDAGVTVSLESPINGVSLSATSFTKADVEAGTAQLTLSYDVATTGATTAATNLVLTAGTTITKVPVMLSVDTEAEQPGNLIYDPLFYSLDRMTIWNNAPTIATISNADDKVYDGATAVKFYQGGSKTGIEAKNLYLAPGEYTFSVWVNTNGTFDAGVYTSAKVLTSSTVATATGSLNFEIPNTKGEWQLFEQKFTVTQGSAGGAWINNDRDRTATEAYADNWQIYPTTPVDNSGEITADNVQDYAVNPVLFTDVTFTDAFWAPRMAQNQETTIPVALEQCESTGRIANFEKAAAILQGNNIGYFDTEYTFDDTDIYKILEGMSYSYATNKNEAMNTRMDELIAKVGAAQESDGYLYTARTAGNPAGMHSWVGANRWEADPDLSHELYNCGHLYEAAYAHYNATGKTALLDIAKKNADLLVKDFLEGGLTYEPGHQIVEMGLVKMYRATNNINYLKLAKYFLDLRGNKGVMRSQYSQSHMPVVLQEEAVGHAVRAAYMYSGMADIAALTGNDAYLNAIDKIWNNVTQKKLYLTGGIGALHSGEAFGSNYELPNLSAYNETCAAIANVYWNWRQFLLHGESKYYDVLERTLYNGVISGIGLDGKSFFYPNPLASDGVYDFNKGSATRQAWFGCACCPSNLCRFLASVPGYVYASKDNDVYVNLFVQNEATITMGETNKVGLKQTTTYPWDGDVTLEITEAPSAMNLNIRIPGWAKDQPVPSDLYTYNDGKTTTTTITVNGTAVEATPNEKGYVTVTRSWAVGDKVQITFPMEVRRVKANANVTEDVDKVALERGPLVYCLEQPDNTQDINSASISADAAISTDENYTVNGNAVTALRISGKSYENDAQLTAIPYYAWANRGVSKMAVWVNTATQSEKNYKFVASEWETGDAGRLPSSSISYDEANNTLTATDAGTNDLALDLKQSADNKYVLKADQHYLLVRGTNLSTEDGKSYLWWCFGKNNGTQEKPQYTFTDADNNVYIVWDITKTTAFGSLWPTSSFSLASASGGQNTIFGLTSADTSKGSTFSDISFYSLNEIVAKYPDLAASMGADYVQLDENSTTYTTPGATAVDVNLTRTLNAGKWNTFCVPFALSAAQCTACGFTEVKAFTGVEKKSDGTIELLFADVDDIEAGKPYLVRCNESKTGLLIDDVTCTADAPLAVTFDGVSFVGNYAKMSITDINKFFIKDNMFYVADALVTVKGFRAYVEMNNTALANRLFINIDGEVTGINAVGEEDKLVDVVSMQGVVVKQQVPLSKALDGLKKGVYLVNDKKMINK